MADPISTEELQRLHEGVADAQRRFCDDINREIGDLPKRLNDVFNRWEDALADLHPDLEVEIRDWSLTPEGISSFTLNITYPAIQD